MDLESSSIQNSGLNRGQNKEPSNQQGQSTIEFALVLIMLMAFVLFFIQLSFVFAYGNFVHYATFMSARAYLSSGIDRGDQVERARSVIVRLLKKSEGESGTERFPAIAKGEGGDDGVVKGLAIGTPQNFSKTDTSLSWQEGVRYTFRSRIFLMPLSGKKDSGPSSLTLTSESWLGRETTTEECKEDLASKKGIFDNGC